MDSVDDLIARIKMEELYRRRKVRGRDLGEWQPQLDAWIVAGETRNALELLGEIIAAVETLEHYDAREPQPCWYEMAANIFRQLDCPQDEAYTLERWLARWPESSPRRRSDNVRKRFAARARTAAMAPQSFYAESGPHLIKVMPGN